MFDVEDDVDDVTKENRYTLDWIRNKQLKDVLIQSSNLRRDLPRFTSQKREVSALPKLMEIRKALEDIPGVNRDVFDLIDAYISQGESIVRTMKTINQFASVIQYIDKNFKNLPSIKEGDIYGLRLNLMANIVLS